MDDDFAPSFDIPKLFDDPEPVVEEPREPALRSMSVVGTKHVLGIRDEEGNLSDFDKQVIEAYIENPHATQSSIAAALGGKHRTSVERSLRKKVVNDMIESHRFGELRKKAIIAYENYLKAGDDEEFRRARKIGHNNIVDVAKDTFRLGHLDGGPAVMLQVNF